ncbi:aminodeoxychorismate/anthranilate synthase component II [Fluviispira multicolorata]|uniref:Glutamine amidotransferase domain-containing protein n=1 Tax=Fluviispira multicolorata TaxID=2654512 RepID=A0A833N4G0_9BACT|nr:aminodeoxychorismate/anthranilate synthase component II [Fluviispira multicolorata]KAB8027765.1 hypothetical protein GCL57_14255 [Fluviispira multicolorata]
MTLLFIDHYDSFSYNLTSWFIAKNVELKIISYNEISLLKDLSQYKAIIFSPGPGHPSEYLESIELYKRIPEHIPFLGVCLGHQIFLLAEGGIVEQINPIPIHGCQVEIIDCKESKFIKNMTPKGSVVLYNSLGCKSSDPIFSNSVVSLANESGFSLIAEHKHLARIGVQFHPESFASPGGDSFLNAFLGFV